MVEADIKPDAALSHWSQFLRCTICFCYFREPHTLDCGHTFCKGCLKRLAEIIKEDSPSLRLRRLNLPCPTCRHPFPAKPSLTGRARKSVILQQMIELWAKECKLLSSSAVVELRSVAIQISPDDREQATKPEANSNPQGPPDNFLSHEVFTEKVRPLDSYFETIMRRVREFAEDMEQEEIIEIKATSSTSPPEGQSHAVNATANDTISSGSETDASLNSSGMGTELTISLSNATDSQLFLRPMFRFTVGRILLMLVWSLYSVMIVGLVDDFLPLVIFFSFFFFLVVLA